MRGRKSEKVHGNAGGLVVECVALFASVAAALLGPSRCHKVTGMD